MSAEAQLRTMRVIWTAMLVSTVVYALVGYGLLTVIGYRPPIPGPGTVPTVLNVLGAVAAILAVPVSRRVRRAFDARAASERRPELVQTGLVIALAVAEVSATLGLVVLVATGDQRAFTFIVVGALAIALLFPGPEPLEAASSAR
jgi:hypothetical protein